MKRIFKYPLETLDIQQIEIPSESEILCVQMQFGKPCIWALVDTDSTIVKRAFETFGTGSEIGYGNRKYIGTYQLLGGQLIYHVFELYEFQP